MTTQTQASGRELEARRFDAALTASPVSEIIRGSSIETASAATWQPRPVEAVLARVRQLPLHSWSLGRLDDLADTLDRLAAECYGGMGGNPDRDLLEAVACKVRGAKAVREYDASASAGRMRLAMVTALTHGDDARTMHGITAEDEALHDQMATLRAASSL